MSNQTEIKREKKDECGCVIVVLYIICAIVAIIIGYTIYDMIPHYHAEINNIKVNFDEYPSKKDSACVNICSEIIKDIAGTHCKIKKINCKWDHFTDYPDPIRIIVVLKYNGHTQRIKYRIMDWDNKTKTVFWLERFYKPRRIENRIKAYPEFQIEKTEFGYTTTKSSLYYRESIDKGSPGKTYYFDENGNRIEPPVPEGSKAS